MTQITTASPGTLSVPQTTPDAMPQMRSAAEDPTALAPPLAGGPQTTSPSASSITSSAPATSELPALPDGSPESVLAMMDPASIRVLQTILPAVMSGDPMILAAALASEMRSESHETQTTGVEIESAADERATAEQAEANRRAEQASRRAGRLLGRAPKWLKKLIEVVVVTASAVATAFSGGAAAGLAIAGAVLILGARGIGKLAVELGMDPEHAGYLEIGCKIAGAALMAGGGLAATGTTAASTASTAARTTQSILQTTSNAISASNQIDNAVRSLGTAVATFRSANHRMDAQGHGLDAQQARDELASVLEDMRATSETYQRVIAQATEALETRQRTQNALIERMA